MLRVASDEQASLAAMLAAGRIFASGRGFVPFVKAELFAKPSAAPDAFQPPPPTEMPVKASSKPTGGRTATASCEPADEAEAADQRPGAPPPDWAGITVGSLVLAAEEGKTAVWYVATVVADRGEDLFELQWWEDDDGQVPLFVRRREHIGLFPAALAGVLV